MSVRHQNTVVSNLLEVRLTCQVAGQVLPTPGVLAQIERIYSHQAKQ